MPMATRPLVGRTEELAAAVRGWRAGHHVALVGPPGVGTTRLAVEVAAKVAPAAALHLTGSPGGRGVDLAPLRARLGGGSPAEVFDALTAAVGRTPWVVVDDAHLLDDATATMLHQVTLAGPARLLLVVDPGVPGPAGVRRLLGLPDLERVRVGPLAAADLQPLVRDWVGGPVEGRTMHRLVTLAAGRPGVLAELVGSSVAAGTLVHDGMVHRLVAGPVPGPALEGRVDDELAGLDDAARDALEVLVVGGPVAVDVAWSVVDPAALETLERRGLLRATEEEGVAGLEVVDPLVAAVVDRRTGTVARRRRNRRLADAADAVGYPARGDTAVRRSVVWAHRGGLEPDAPSLLAAARASVAEGEVLLGAELAAASFDKGQDAASALLAAWCFAREAERDRGLDLLNRALEVATDPWERATLAQQAAGEFWWSRGDGERARALLAPADLPAGPWWGLLTAQGAMFDFLDGSVATGLEAVAAAGEVADGHSRFVLTLAHGLALALADRGAEGAARAEAAYAESAAVADDLYGNPEFHALALVMGLMYEGRLEEAAGLSALLYDAAVRLAEPHNLGWAATFSGAIAFLAGDLESAAAHLAEAEAAFLEALLPGTARWAVAVGVLVAHARGDVAAGADGRRRREGYRIDGFRLFEPLERLGDAWAALDDGRSEQARVLALAAIDEAAAAGSWSHAAHAAHDLARFGWWDEATAALARLPAPGSALTQARIAFVRAGAADDGAGLDAASAGFEALGALLFAAEASACAAAAHRRAGRNRSATAGAARMTALLASCPGARTPPLRRSGGTDLTAREEQVAVMAAAGRTNRAIADELGIAERTVENHLYRAFAKLAVTTRGELGPALDGRAVLTQPRTD